MGTSGLPNIYTQSPRDEGVAYTVTYRIQLWALIVKRNLPPMHSVS